MASAYTYLAADLRTNAILGELPLKRVAFSTKLNQIGHFNGAMELSDPGVKAEQVLSSSQPGRTALYVDRNGVLVWGGIVWTRKYTSGDFLLDIGAEDFTSFYRSQFLNTTKVYVAADQLFIVRDLVNYVQGQPGNNIGVAVGSQVSGIARTQTWNPYDLKGIYDAISELAAEDAGFDWAIDVAYVAGVPTKTLTLNFPRRGAIAPQTGWVFEYPGNVQDYTWPEDSTQQGVTCFLAGAGEGASMLISSNTVTALIDGGYPNLQRLDAYKSITNPAVLASHAVADAKAFSQPVTLPELWVRADMDPSLGSYIAGDDCRVRITDPRWPAPSGTGIGLDAIYRIQQIEVTPQDQQAEKVKLTLALALQ